MLLLDQIMVTQVSVHVIYQCVKTYQFPPKGLYIDSSFVIVLWPLVVSNCIGITDFWVASMTKVHYCNHHSWQQWELLLSEGNCLSLIRSLAHSASKLSSSKPVDAHISLVACHSFCLYAHAASVSDSSHPKAHPQWVGLIFETTKSDSLTAHPTMMLVPLYWIYEVYTTR